MSDGQLAMNTNLVSPGLFLKDSNGDLVKVGPVHVGTTAPNATPGAGGQAGNSKGEQWLDTSSSRYVFKIWDGTAWRTEDGEFVNASGDTMTGALGIIAGTNTAPGVFFSGDTNTGIYSPGADQVAISTNGTGRLTVDSAGTTTLTSAAATAPFIAKVSASEVARIDSSGRLLVGTSNVINVGTLNQGIQLAGTGGPGNLTVSRYTNDVTGSLIGIGKSRSTTVGGFGIVSADDNLGQYSFYGADGAAFVEAARVSAQVDGTPGANDMPGRLVMSVTLDGASSPTEALRITNDRVVAYNQAAPAAVNTTTTITAANLKTGIITSTTAAAVTMTLPTGTDIEAGFSGIYTNMTFEFSVINTGPNTLTVGANGNTTVGSLTVATLTSARYALRRTGANAFTLYRLS